MQPVKIAILLSTFNGERWLPELLRSLRSQSLPFELIWRDDGSTDATKELIRGAEWRQLTEAQHSEADANMGACASFAVLMESALNSEADIFFLADQDDVWAPEKLGTIFSRFSFSSIDEPLLLHHDLRVVNEGGDEIAPSLWRFMRLDAQQNEVARFLTRNSVTGCGTAFNRALLEIATPVPATALMHDWWLGLVASAFGQIRTEKMCLVDYRQHAGNVLGARGFFQALSPFTNWVAGWKRGNEEYRALFPQARALLALLQSHPDVAPGDLADVKAFMSIPDLPFLERCREADRLGLRDRFTLLWLVAMLRAAFMRL